MSAARYSVVVALALVSIGCRGDSARLHIGAKDFPEQLVLAEVVAEVITNAGISRPQIINCGNTTGCDGALYAGRVDLMVEYTGTALNYQGVARIERHAVMEQLRKLGKSHGLTWLDPMGFDNGYRVVVPTHRATALKLRTIADLTSFAEGIRVVCPPTYVGRPIDGLASLLSRHGLRLRGKPLLIAKASERYHALLTNRADVAVGYGTDGGLRDLGVTVLEDNLGFYPPYQAAIVVRSQALKEHRGLKKILDSLKGRIDGATMRWANYQAQVQGRGAGTVARALLRRLGLITEGAVGRRPLRDLQLIYAKHDRLESAAVKTTRVIHRVFPERAVQLRKVDDPVEAIVRGKADLALLGAERFFPSRRGRVRGTERRIEAVAVISTRAFHLLRRADEEADRKPLDGRVGVEHSDNAAGRAVASLLGMGGVRIATTDSAAKLLARLKDKSLDAAVIVGEAGDAFLARAIAEIPLKLVPLPRLESQRLLPYLRPLRIPSGTYKEQDSVVETIGSQLLLAMRSPHADAVGKPLQALSGRGPQLSAREMQRLLDVTLLNGRPDPLLPTAAPLHAALKKERRGRATGKASDILLNSGVFAFLIWLAWVVIRAP